MIAHICENWTTKICSFQPLCRLIVRIDQGLRPGSHDQIANWIGFNRFSSKSHRFHFSYAVSPVQRFLNLFSLAMKKTGFCGKRRFWLVSHQISAAARHGMRSEVHRIHLYLTSRAGWFHLKKTEWSYIGLPQCRVPAPHPQSRVWWIL